MGNQFSRSMENMRDRLSNGRAAITDAARLTANGAGDRLGTAYGKIRDGVADAAADPKRVAADLLEDGAASAAALAAAGRELGSSAITTGRQVMNRAGVASRGLIAERPLTAVVLGVAAGAVLGLLAEQVAKRRAARRASEAQDAETDPAAPSP